LPQRALYSATKGAVLALTRAMAADLVAEGIRVYCVNPGTADTPWIGRLVTADEVAGAIAYLASPASGATTGTGLAVDGGMSGLRVRPRD
jgi:2-keto-3-deoxy-L-fuconate dehydrogenase